MRAKLIPVLSALAAVLVLGAVIRTAQPGPETPADQAQETLKDAIAELASSPQSLLLQADPIFSQPTGRLVMRFTAKVVDSTGMLLPGHRVAFSVVSGSAAVDPAESVTDSVGQARATLVPWDARQGLAEAASVRACIEGTKICAYASVDPDEL